MGFVLALIARYRSASVSDFSVEALADPVISGLREKVHMIVDNRIDSAYPEKWGSRVEVKMKSGALFAAFTDCPKGDPGNMLSQQELEQKGTATGRIQWQDGCRLNQKNHSQNVETFCDGIICRRISLTPD